MSVRKAFRPAVPIVSRICGSKNSKEEVCLQGRNVAPRLIGMTMNVAITIISSLCYQLPTPHQDRPEVTSEYYANISNPILVATRPCASSCKLKLIFISTNKYGIEKTAFFSQ